MFAEQKYLEIMEQIMVMGSRKEGRNGGYTSLPFPQLSFDVSTHLPLITTRKMFTKGILGEYAAMIRGPKHIDDFRKWGCNYWDKWANKTDGSIDVDYGNAWRDYNGVNQMEQVLDKLKNKPGDRRILIDAWRPDRLDALSLPCCHYSYQFWTDGVHLDMLWHQRSADWCVGVPSDMVFASVMLACFAQLAGLQRRNVVMQFGDAHIYDEHREGALEQMKRNPWLPPEYILMEQEDLYSFEPDDLLYRNYQHHDPIKFELKD